MPGGSRALPSRPNLRHLRLEAKRRLAAGEFGTLHDAQTAVAREHGQPSWAALKQVILAGPNGQPAPDSHALTQLRWVISRFSGADETGWAAPDAAAQLVLAPLGLRDSSFPARPADVGPGAVSSYNLGLEGIFEPIPAVVSTLQAVAGLWSTGADLVRLGFGWSSLLPESLAHEALTPQTPQAQQAPLTTQDPQDTKALQAPLTLQAPRTPQALRTPQAPQDPQTPPAERAPRTGLGWLISPRGDLATHAGGGLEGTAALTIRIRDNRLHVVLTSRLIPINSIDVALLRAWTNPPEE
jgi:Beta-lactamase